ncbi:MAG: ester cyclase [Ignavibacteriaceae bacterium]|jgi:predicted ester cyclase
MIINLVEAVKAENVYINIYNKSGVSKMNSNCNNLVKYSPLFIVSGLICIILLFAGSAEGQQNEKDNTEVEKNKSTIQKYIDEMNKRNEDYINDYFATNYIYHGPNGDLDLDGLKKFHHEVLSALPDLVIKAEDIIASGDKVVTRWEIRGTQKRMLMGVKPTGKEITIKGIIISRFENGKVVEEWEEANGVNILQQLGVLPPPKN